MYHCSMETTANVTISVVSREVIKKYVVDKVHANVTVLATAEYLNLAYHMMDKPAIVIQQIVCHKTASVVLLKIARLCAMAKERAGHVIRIIHAPVMQHTRGNFVK